MIKYPVAVEVAGCRLCGGALESVLNFGSLYISDFLAPGQQGQRAPLHVMRCPKCGLIQTLHTIDKQLLWGDRYWYKSGTNESMVAALRDLAEQGAPLQPGDRVLDIGANDGTLLSFYPKDVHKVAVDPIASFKGELARAADVVVRDFWPTEIDGNFQRISSIACFYDVDDPHSFVQAIKEVLAPNGRWIVQMQDEESILRDVGFDYFCHEHVCLYSVATFSWLCAEHGLQVLDWEANEVNGGSLRFTVGHAARSRGIYPALRWGLEENARRWTWFKVQAEVLRAAGQRLVTEVAREHTIYGVAASTKFNTVLQWYGLDETFISCILERAPEKIGRVTAGSGIPIVGEDTARPLPDYYLAGAWHFLDGLRARHPERPFLTLLPEVREYAALAAAHAAAR